MPEERHQTHWVETPLELLSLGAVGRAAAIASTELGLVDHWSCSYGARRVQIDSREAGNSSSGDRVVHTTREVWRCPFPA